MRPGDWPRFSELMDELSMNLLAEDLEHGCWVVLCWTKGNDGSPPEAAHGPFVSVQEALAKAEHLRWQMEHAEGRHTFLAGYTPTFNVVPVYGDEDDAV